MKLNDLYDVTYRERKKKKNEMPVSSLFNQYGIIYTFLFETF
jgi:hypothetical protein